MRSTVEAGSASTKAFPPLARYVVMAAVASPPRGAVGPARMTASQEVGIPAVTPVSRSTGVTVYPFERRIPVAEASPCSRVDAGSASP